MDVTTALALGVLTIVGGRGRTTGPAWDTLNASGGPLVWGVVLVVLAGVLVAATFWRPGAVLAALVALAIVYGLVGWWFFVSAIPGGASFWGAVLCARAMGMHLSRAWAYYERLE